MSAPLQDLIDLLKTSDAFIERRDEASRKAFLDALSRVNQAEARQTTRNRYSGGYILLVALAAALILVFFLPRLLNINSFFLPANSSSLTATFTPTPDITATETSTSTDTNTPILPTLTVQTDPDTNTPAPPTLTVQTAAVTDSASPSHPSVSTRASNTIVPTLPCPTAVYYSDAQSINPALGCPTQSWVSVMDYQRFSGGVMFWRKTPTPTIYIVLNSGAWSQRADPGGTANGSCTLAQQTGGLGPIYGFGTLWCQDSTLRSQLGQPLTAEGSVPQSQIQDFQHGTAFTVGSLGRFVLYPSGWAH
jgi:hypothetical protein